MKAAVLYKPHTPLKVEELDLDEPKEGEIRVKLVGAGVCHSDYNKIDGHNDIKTLPMVLGHEGAGIVQQMGPGVTSLAPGDHVVLSLARQCGRCRNCAAGRPNLCEGHQAELGNVPGGTSRFSKDGVPYYHGLATFTEETVVLADKAVKVRDDISLEKACLIGCGVMTGVGAVVNRAKVEAGRHRGGLRLRRCRTERRSRGRAGRGVEDHRRRQGAVQAGKGIGDGRDPRRKRRS